MKKKSLSAKKTIHKRLFSHLKNKKIKKVFKEFKKNLDHNSHNNHKKYNIGVAISGGPDSLALAFLAKCYALQNNLVIKFFIVNHNLRKNSANEANSVKLFLSKFDINCKILTWKGKKPLANIQGIARNYRYDLLKKECKKNSIYNLLIGHHIDDLYENFFIRLLRGSGLKGLSSFGEVINQAGKDFLILRPLIKFEKQDLIYISLTVFKFFIKDPSNEESYFQRPRIRKIISEFAKEGFNKKKLSLTIKNLGYANNAINFYVEKNINDNAKFIKKTNSYILNNFFFQHSEEVIFRSISLILRKISTKYYSPRGQSIFKLILKINSNISSKFTLGGCYIEKIKETVIITREN